MNENNMITYGELLIHPFDFLTIEELTIKKNINQHSNLKIAGKVQEDLARQYLEQTSSENEIHMKQLNGNILFHGVIHSMKLKKNGEVYILSVEAYSNTIRMDMEKKRRSFQDITATYKDIIELIMSEYENSNVMISREFHEPTGRFFLQYDETDWEFVRRLVSHKNESLFPCVETDYLAFYAGAPMLDRNTEITVSEYEINRSQGEFLKAEKNMLSNVMGVDFSAYTIRSFHMLELGERVMFQGNFFFIKSAVQSMEQAGLEGVYVLSTKNGLRKVTEYNSQLRGGSLKGIVLAIQRDQVKLHLYEADQEQKKETACWFPYSTIYASQDGSGWYCMPEAGDEVRLQVPDVDEKSAFAVSAVSSYQPGKGQADRMNDHERRYIRNPQGMEVMWTPKQVIVSANGNSKLILDENGTIYVQSKTVLSISAGKKIELNAGEEVKIQASDHIAVQCGGKAEITMDKEGKTELKGNKVYIN